MRLGLQVPNFTYPNGQLQLGDTFAHIAEMAERAGFYSLWVMDHFFQIAPIGPPEEPMLEGWSALAYAAGRTQRIRLGTMVTGITYRHPGILVKTATTLDVLSGGRTYFGIGAAWNEAEHRGLGVPFPPLAERFERLEEALRIAKQMWSGKVGPFEGRHYRLAEALCVPRPLSRPHPPILIGGMGERKTLRLVARHADACNLFVYAGVEGVRKKLEVLRRHCDAERRDYDSIERTTLGTVHLAPGKQSPSDVIRELAALARAGVQHAIVNLPNVHELAPVETLAKEVVPAIAGL